MNNKNEVGGCLIEKKGRYYTYVYYKIEGVRQGKTKSMGISVSSHKKREAEHILKERIEQTQKELDAMEEAKTHHSFAECFARWIDYKESKIGASTADGYREKSKTIIEYFKEHDVMIEKLEARDLLAFYEWALANGRRNIYREGANRGLSRRTVRDQAALIKRFLRDAVLQKVISVNPAESISVPKVKEKHVKERGYMDLEEVKRFMNYIKSVPMFEKLVPICTVGFYYGLRRSEMLGLSWNVIDFEKDSIEIRQTVVRTTKEIIHVENVKTNSSHRFLPLLEDVKAELLKVRENQKRLGIYDEKGYVFIADDGSEYDPDYISKLFKKAVTRCPDVPKNVTFHGMRHSCCAILFQSGYDIATVQKWLGHADITVTANIYNHVSKKWQNELGRGINGLLREEESSSEFQQIPTVI